MPSATPLPMSVIIFNEGQSLRNKQIASGQFGIVTWAPGGHRRYRSSVPGRGTHIFSAESEASFRDALSILFSAYRWG